MNLGVQYAVEQEIVTKRKLEILLNASDSINKPIYITGNFNNWETNHSDFRMTKIGKGLYHLVIDEITDDQIEYKYTLGGWENVELDEYGNETKNRIVENPSGRVTDYVNHWKDNGAIYSDAFYPIIELVDDDFLIPQLNKSRRVRVVLPYNYYQTDKTYPVIYMQDGQNLFDQAAPFGNWGMDKRMAVLAEYGKGDFIIVCVDHAERERISEYNPYLHTSKLGKGMGRLYVRFLAETLKPFIDQKYRTKSERDCTGIGGSSLGGLISIYAGLMFPESFGRLLIFSPSLWAAKNMHFDAINFFNPYHTKIYVYAGGQEGSGMVPLANKFKDAIEKRGMDDSLIDFHLSVDPDGMHTEKKWGEEFPKAIEWLFF